MTPTPTTVDLPTNGKGKHRLLTREVLDQRTRAAQHFDAIARGIANDLGGQERLSTVMKHLIEGFAGAAIHVHDLNARLLLNEKVDVVGHAQAISVMVRLASRIGLGRMAKNVVPSLHQYLNGKRAKARDDDDVEEAEIVR